MTETSWRCDECGLTTVRALGDENSEVAWCEDCEWRTMHRTVSGRRVELPSAGVGPAGTYQAGIAGSERAADHRWTGLERFAVDNAIKQVARRLGEFTADDIWEALGPDFPVTKGLAGRLNAALNARIITSTGRVTVSQRQGVHGHAQRLAVWRSLVTSPNDGEEPPSRDGSVQVGMPA